MKWLNVSHNRLAWFDFAFVPPSVEWLDVVGNKIDALGNYYGLLVSGDRKNRLKTTILP